MWPEVQTLMREAIAESEAMPRTLVIAHCVVIIVLFCGAKYNRLHMFGVMATKFHDDCNPAVMLSLPRSNSEVFCE